MHSFRLSGPGSRDGSIQPLMAGLLLLVATGGFLLLEQDKQRIVQKQGVAAARAIALDALLASHEITGKERSPDAGFFVERARRIGLANGMGDHAFQPVQKRDIIRAGTWVAATVRPFDPRQPPITVIAQGMPARRIAPGGCMGGGSGQKRPTGCLPLGIQVAGIPAGDAARSMELVLNPRDGDAAPVRFAGASSPVAQQVRFLGAPGRSDSSGCAPPEVVVGASVELLEATDDYLAALDEGLAGKTVIVPYLDGTRVVGFGRLQVEAVDRRQARLRFRLAPSAVVPGQGVQELETLTAPRTDVSPFGLALQAAVKG